MGQALHKMLAGSGEEGARTSELGVRPVLRGSKPLYVQDAKVVGECGSQLHQGTRYPHHHNMCFLSLVLSNLCRLALFLSIRNRMKS
jgi:hypothetical protein